MPKINRYWNSDPDSLVERKPPQTYDLCKCCELVNQLVWKEKRLKRALWLMTSEWAEAMGLASCNIAIKLSSKERFFYYDEVNREKDIKKYKHRQVVFYKYADYCRAKYEEYK